MPFILTGSNSIGYLPVLSRSIPTLPIGQVMFAGTGSSIKRTGTSVVWTGVHALFSPIYMN